MFMSTHISLCPVQTTLLQFQVQLFHVFPCIGLYYVCDEEQEESHLNTIFAVKKIVSICITSMGSIELPLPLNKKKVVCVYSCKHTHTQIKNIKFLTSRLHSLTETNHFTDCGCWLWLKIVGIASSVSLGLSDANSAMSFH